MDDINSTEPHSSSTSSSDDENYVFKAKMCTRLSRELQLPEFQFEDMGSYEPQVNMG